MERKALFLSQENTSSMVSLKKLHVWMCTPIQRLKSLAAIADTCQGLIRRNTMKNVPKNNSEEL